MSGAAERVTHAREEGATHTQGRGDIRALEEFSRPARRPGTATSPAMGVERCGGGGGTRLHVVVHDAILAAQLPPLNVVYHLAFAVCNYFMLVCKTYTMVLSHHAKT